MLRFIRDLGIGLIAGCVVGLLIILFGGDTKTALLVGLGAGIVLFLIAYGLETEKARPSAATGRASPDARSDKPAEERRSMADLLYGDWSKLLAAFTRQGRSMRLDVAPGVTYVVNPVREQTGLFQIAFWFSWWGDWQLMCTVVSPSGRTMFHTYQASRAMGKNRFVGVYPRDFTTVEVARPVEYQFRWARVDSDGYEGEVLWKDYVTVTEEAAAVALGGQGGTAAITRREVVSPQLRRT